LAGVEESIHRCRLLRSVFLLRHETKYAKVVPALQGQQRLCVVTTRYTAARAAAPFLHCRPYSLAGPTILKRKGSTLSTSLISCEHGSASSEGEHVEARRDGRSPLTPPAAVLYVRRLIVTRRNRGEKRLRHSTETEARNWGLGGGGHAFH
jgi:hypothetical protein